MHLSRLGRMKHLLLAVMAMLAFGVVTASAAQAENGPFYSVGSEGKRLGAGETRPITAKIFSENFTLTAGTRKVICTGVEAKEGSDIIGSAEGEAGKDEEILRYTGCKVEGNGTKCAVEKGEVVTEKLRSELVEDAATKKKLLIDFLPPEGKVVFATLKFVAETGGTCEVKETKVTGIDVLAEALTETGEPIELGGVSPGLHKSGRIEVENPQPTAFWLIKEGTGKEVKIATAEKLNAFGVAATLVGTASVELASGEVWSALA